MLQNEIEERVKALASYIIETGSTVRKAAKEFNVSKSTVHKDIAERLIQINPKMATEAQKILEHNKQERHIRGGYATKMKYKCTKTV